MDRGCSEANLKPPQWRSHGVPQNGAIHSRHQLTFWGDRPHPSSFPPTPGCPWWGEPTSLPHPFSLLGPSWCGVGFGIWGGPYLQGCRVSNGLQGLQGLQGLSSVGLWLLGDRLQGKGMNGTRCLGDPPRG